MKDIQRKLAAVAALAAFAGTLTLTSCGSTEEPATPVATETVTASPTQLATTAPTDDEDHQQSTAASNTPQESEDDADDNDDAALPTNAADYADALIRAWGAGDKDQMDDFAADAVVDTLTSHAAKGGDGWKRTSQDAGAGSVFLTYRNAGDKAEVELRVDNAKASAGDDEAVVEAKFTK